MNKEIKFNSKSLLDIKFDKNVKGYDPLMVDQTLDEIINDYKVFEKLVSESSEKLANLNQEIDSLKKKYRLLEIELAKCRENLKAIPKGSNQDNVSLLKRIDALERALYKQGVDPQKI